MAADRRLTPGGLARDQPVIAFRARARRGQRRVGLRVPKRAGRDLRGAAASPRFCDRALTRSHRVRRRHRYDRRDHRSARRRARSAWPAFRRSGATAWSDFPRSLAVLERVAAKLEAATGHAHCARLRPLLLAGRPAARICSFSASCSAHGLRRALPPY